MSESDFDQELNALREKLPTVIEGDTRTKSAAQYYSKALADTILDDYAKGMSLHAISRKSEMPCYGTLLRWSRDHDEFRASLRAVRETRALHFEDSAIAAAEAADGKDRDRLLFDAYKWGAEVNDPLTYGKRVTHEGNNLKPITIQVVTGFGPPNEWQTPPKLNADGTIIKENIREVKADVATENPGTVQRPDHTPGSQENDGSSATETGHVGAEPAGGDRPPDVVRSDGGREPSGVQALHPVQGHTSELGSQESTSVRVDGV